jgi:hypothetical protein
VSSSPEARRIGASSSYLCAIFEHTESLAALSPIARDELVSELAPILRPDGRASALWGW